MASVVTAALLWFTARSAFVTRAEMDRDLGSPPWREASAALMVRTQANADQIAILIVESKTLHEAITVATTKLINVASQLERLDRSDRK